MINEMNINKRFEMADRFKIDSCSRIVARRIINQHNIDSYVLRLPSTLCFHSIVFDEESALINNTFQKELDQCVLPCNRCDHRDDMDDNPDRAYNGYVRWKI